MGTETALVLDCISGFSARTIRDKRRERISFRAPVGITQIDWADQRTVQHEFILGAGRDISQGGMCLTSPVAIRSKFIIVHLCLHAKPVYVLSDVLRSCRGYWNKKLQMMVACRFLRRLSSLDEPFDDVLRDLH